MPGLLLHVGCGNSPMPEWAQGNYEEVRLDISPDCQPDILAPMTDLGDIGPFDAIACNHALEHIFPHEVTKALSEFHRVLADDGAVVLFVPDLEGVKATHDVVYDSPAGPITGLDMIYGKASMVEDNPYMAHKTGFTQATLRQAFEDAGFSKLSVQRISHNLMVVAGK